MEQLEANWTTFKKGVIAALRESGATVRRILKEAHARIAQNQDPTLGQIGPVLMQQSLYFLQKNQDEWERAYPAYLLNAFSEVVDFDPFQDDDDITSSLGGLGAGNDLSIQTKSDLLHLRNALESAVSHSLNQLDGLVSAARGYSYIHPNRNPMRPENYLLAAQKMIYASQGEDAVKSLALKSFVAVLPTYLARTYMLVANKMSEAGVEAVQKRNTSFGALTTGFGNMSYLNTGINTNSEDLLTKEELLRTLGDQAHLYVLNKPAQPPQPEHMDALHLPEADFALTQPGRASKSAAPVPQPEPEALDLQTLVIHLVKDTSHLPTLKKIVAQWMPALRALVQNDPAFLRSAAHPARAFLGEVRTKAKQFASEQAPGCQDFLQRVQTISHTARLAQARSTEAFQWASEQLLNTPRPSATASAPGTGTEINADALLKKVIDRISVAPLYTAAHPRVRAFLSGPWAKVIAKSLLRHARDSGESFADEDALIARDPKGYLRLVNLLLLSVQAENFRHPAPELLRSVKDMHEQLRVGLLSVGLSAEQVEPAVSKLKDLHRQAIQEATAESPQDGGVQILYASPEGQAIDIGQPRAAAAPAATPSARMAVPRLTEPPEESSGDPKSKDASGPDLPPMQVGAWFFLGESGLRTQLSWASPDEGIFMFTSPDGFSQTMTRRRLLQLQESGQLRPE
ncbi:MAG: DUF1631 family protein [Comamonadaceae bacterium]|nr:DUF1631 family protein [Comamonadaceae bacterium]